jgi:hypothetical protein
MVFCIKYVSRLLLLCIVRIEMVRDPPSRAPMSTADSRGCVRDRFGVKVARALAAGDRRQVGRGRLIDLVGAGRNRTSYLCRVWAVLCQ